MRTITKYWRAFVSLFLLLISKIITRKENYIAFGSWKGELYIDNSRYLFETALKMLDERYTFIWIGNSFVSRQLPEDNRVVCCKKNSIKSFLYLLGCKYMFCSQMHYEDLSNYNVFSGAIITYLHHGCPVKMWGDDVSGSNKAILGKIDKLTGKHRKLDFFVCSSEAHYLTNLTALKSWGCVESNNLKTGTPRNDMLLCENSEKNRMKYKSEYGDLLGFDSKKKVILYVPTFRRSGVCNESLVYRSKGETDRLHEILKRYNSVLIEKAHFAGSFNSIVSSICYDDIISCSKKVNLQEMLLFADCVISDYSGAFLDYSILDRPIIHYIYDYEFYRDVDSGLYYEFDEFQAGPAAKTFDDLLIAIESCLSDSTTGQNMRRRVCHKFMEYEVGTASEQIINTVIKQGFGQ